ncbi:MAG: ABC transporter ATP-binding protein [Acutalibacteraceae bacterium]|nr:ABC transporter ATP-binding protein [Acutalibacteraceae bacterium]
MKPIIKILGRYKKEAILGPLFKLLEALFELFVPLVVASLIDYGIASQNKQYIINMILILILLAVIGLVCSITAQYFAAKAAVGVGTKLRSDLFKKIQGLSFTELDKLGTSTMITRMTSDVNQVQSGVNLVLRLFLRSPFIVFGAMIMAFTIDFDSALVFVCAIPVLAVVVFAIMLISIPLYKRVQSNLDKVTSKTRENLTGARVIRAFCMEEQEIESFKELNEELSKTQKYVGRISALMNPATYVIINIAIVVLVYVGAIRVEQGIITQGAVVALYNYMSQILVELIKLANLIITTTKSVACANRVATVLEMESSLEKVPDDRIETQNHIDFIDVSLTYKDAGEESLSNISFGVKRGETVGIIGGTGSGKSSLVNLIPHFYDCTKGGVYVDGINVKSYPENELRDKIGIVLQKAVLFKGTIKENIIWGKSNATDTEIEKALKIAQAKDIIASKKNGINEKIEQGGKNLSGGQRQRLTIARAIVKQPEILILDDSASALDYATDAKLRKDIKGLNDTTVFIVSQRTSSIMSADKIIVLDDGKIASIGTHSQLLESCDVYKEIYYSQTDGQVSGQ